MTTYDIKIYEYIHPLQEEAWHGEKARTVEHETIKDLKYSQMIAITAVLRRHDINHSVKNLETDEVSSFNGA